MSNNKQGMKIYTEADLKKVISIYSEEYKTSTDEILKELNLTHIEIPSDEEIEKLSWIYTFNKFGEVDDFIDAQDGFEDGLRWLRDKIQGGNNEQQ